MSGPPFNPLIDLDELSHEKFVDKASEVIIPFNPEGQPPPGVYSPTMKNLIDRLEISRNEDRPSYASVIQNSSPTSSSSSVQSYRGSVLTEDRSSRDESANIQSLKSASSRKRKTPPKVKVQEARKKTVSFLILDMERTKNSQYAISTVQETSAMPRRVGSREVIVTERLGDFYKGRKKITSSALNKHAASTTSTAVASSGSKDVIDFDASIDDNSSDENDAVQDYSQEQHDDVLFPWMTVKQEPSRRHNKVASLQDKDYAALTSKAVDETDISDASSDDSVIGYELSTTGSSQHKRLHI